MSVAETDLKPQAHDHDHDHAPAQAPTGEDAPMVALSDKAAEKIKEIRGEENIEDSYALRLKVQGGGCRGSRTTSTSTRARKAIARSRSRA